MDLRISECDDHGHVGTTAAHDLAQLRAAFRIRPVSAWLGSVNSWCAMLSPGERQVLQAIERGLQGSDPDLARSLERLTPLRSQLNLRWMLFLMTISATLVVVVGVTLSNLTIGLIGITVSTAASSAYVVVLIRDRMRRRLPR
jgi:hypothetical protein